MNYDKLKQIIQQANPDIVDKRAIDEYGYPKTDDIRLADVLLAIHIVNPYSYMVTIQGDFWIWKDAENPPYPLEINWNLRNDNLDHQSEETKAFLIELLL